MRLLPPLLLAFLTCVPAAAAAAAFSPRPPSRPPSAAAATAFATSKVPPRSTVALRSSSPSDSTDDPFLSSPSPSPSVDALERRKLDLIRLCDASSSSSDGGGGKGKGKPSLEDVRRMVAEVEDLGEQVGIGQGSSHSGLISGEWELLYSPEDDTRSSPFFWAFRRAFPDSSDQIFGITDAIPAPIKEVGPATQTIDLDTMSSSSFTDKASGTLVSRVKVATLGGLATSIMTTRAAILSREGLDGLRLKIESTKPEESTILEKLGPLGQFVSENAPPFPSGEALERAMPGSSEVVMRTTYCDEGLRISRNEEVIDEPFVWRRKTFGGGSNFEV